MEFKLTHVNIYEKLEIKFIDIRCEKQKHSYLAFKIQHNGKSYNTLVDDVLYFAGELKRWLTTEEIEIIINAGNDGMNSAGLRLGCTFWGYSDIKEFKRFINYLYGRQICIREPENPNNIMTVEKNVNVIKYIERERIKNEIKYVEVIKNVPIPVVTELKDIEICQQCKVDKAIVSFLCCPVNYCPKCAIKIFTANSQCAECRKRW